MKQGFSERLEGLRGDESVRSFAARLGISHTALANYLKGTNDPTLSVLERIVSVTGVNLNWLAIGKGPMREGDGEQDRGSEKQSESYDYEVVHSVAWVIAEEEGKDPRAFADKFAGMCEYLQQTKANPEKEDMKKVVKIFDFAMKRRGQ